MSPLIKGIIIACSFFCDNGSLATIFTQQLAEPTRTTAQSPAKRRLTDQYKLGALYLGSKPDTPFLEYRLAVFIAGTTPTIDKIIVLEQ